ncbi:DUF3140 domain-containing protein [Sphingobium aromaticiconvertens]|uniref:DUF3140 domain-containing protein n=1 Tax=Sphingobium aromaticiconvertens TaxID=365341 RepID=UPI00301AD7DB
MDNETVHMFMCTINMGADELDEWLQTSESNAVGWKGRNGLAPESVGHASGRRIAQILRRPQDELRTDEIAFMRKCIGYIRRHSAQRPDNVFTSRWRYSLKNWGYDPVKDIV